MIIGIGSDLIDIRRVANQIFVSANRTVGIIENIPAASASKGGQQ